MSVERPRLALLCRVLTHVCALPIEHVEETMRPLPVEPLAGVPSFVRGLAIIRGNPTPVVDAAALLSAGEGRPSRFVTVKAADRRVALAVDAVVGVRAITFESLHELPPLLRDASSDTIAAIGTLDAELLLVLRSARLAPEAVWTALDTDGQAR